MASHSGPDLLEGIVPQLIDEEALGVCFEMHRAIKLGYYELLYPDDRWAGLHDVICCVCVVYTRLYVPLPVEH